MCEKFTFIEITYYVFYRRYMYFKKKLNLYDVCINVKTVSAMIRLIDVQYCTYMMKHVTGIMLIVVRS